MGPTTILLLEMVSKFEEVHHRVRTYELQGCYVPAVRADYQVQIRVPRTGLLDDDSSCYDTPLLIVAPLLGKSCTQKKRGDRNRLLPV